MYDFVIIGSGFSGMTIFNELSSRGKNVLLVSGKKRHTNYRFSSQKSNLHIDAFKGVGGGLNVWGKLLRVFDKRDFESSRKFHRYQSYIERSLEYFNMGNLFSIFFSQNKYHIKFFNNHLSGIPFIKGSNSYFKEIIKKSIKFSSINSIYTKKFNSGILINHEVNLIQNYKKKLYSIELVGNTKHVICKKIILAAGVFDSPAILHYSIKNGLKGIHNSAKNNIGKNLKDHVMGPIASIESKDGIDLKFFKNQSKFIKFAYKFPKNLIYNYCFYVVSTPTKIIKGNDIEILLYLFALLSKPMVFIKKLPFFIKNLLKILKYILTKIICRTRVKNILIWAILEQKKSIKNYIIFDEKKNSKNYSIAWNINNDIHDQVNKIYKLCKIYFPNNYKINKTNMKLVKNYFSSCAHQTGTLSQMPLSKKGVVDNNFKIYGSNNIYCADASVVTESGHANITLSVVINSLILADHLNEN